MRRVAARNLTTVRLRRTTALTGALLGLLLAGGTVPATAAPAPPKPTTTPAPPLPDPLPGRGPDGTVVGGDRLGARGLVLPAGAPRLPADLTAQAWVVADLDTGEVLAARDPHARYQPASCQKILTALTLLPRLTDRKRFVRGTDDDVRIDGTRVGIVTDGRYTVDFLFGALLMVSGNDAANALARANGGIPRTVAEMNATAKELQAYDTRAATPSGLDGPGQLTSAYDLALLSRAALERADFRRYVTTLKGRVPSQGKWKGFEIANHNRLLYNYPGAIGVKNGFTDLARHTYVGAAERNGRRLVVTFLRAEQQPVQVWTQAARLLDWGFRLPRGLSPVGTLVGRAETTAPSAPAAAPTAAGATPVAGPAAEGGSFPLLPAAGGLAGAALLLGSGGALLERRRRKSAGPRP